jgi:hypothetical protein
VVCGYPPNRHRWPTAKRAALDDGFVDAVRKQSDAALGVGRSTSTVCDALSIHRPSCVGEHEPAPTENAHRSK